MKASLRAELERRAPGEWELYSKRAESRELLVSTDGGGAPRGATRSEEGWAARWWERGTPRFAAGSSEAELSFAIRDAARVTAASASPPAWPTATSPPLEDPGPAPAPPELSEALARLLAAESRGEAVLAELSVATGARTERIVNGRGGDVSLRTEALEGFARGEAYDRWSEDVQQRALDTAICARDDLPQPAAVELSTYLPFLRLS